LPGAGDFDFFVGSWTGRSRRLAKPLTGDDDWDEFSYTVRCWQLFDGAANIDEMKIPDLGFSGVSLRLLDPATGQWSIYWVNSRDGRLLLPPVVGCFTDGVGRFYSPDFYDGMQIMVRYTWSHVTATSAHWDQAFSTDGGQTWETNWITEFTRQT
jgi:hypothetical protein